MNQDKFKIVTNNKLFNMKEASEYLNIAKSSLYQICMRREIKLIKIGKRNLFRLEDLDAFINKNVRESK